MQSMDVTEVKKAINLIKSGTNGLFEIRVFGGKSDVPTVGYFKDAQTAIDALAMLGSKGQNVYIVLNEINEQLFYRDTRDKFINRAQATKDEHILARQWLLIDFDPVRVAGISSTDEQVKLANERMVKVAQYLDKEGFQRPVIGFSGNGYHLLYRIAMKNSEENKDRIKKFLKALDIMFSDDQVKIDTANFNASRICKLYGTLAQKGSNTPETPHRMSRICSVPPEIKVTTAAYFDKINAMFPEKSEEPQRYNGYDGRTFDVQKWLDEHQVLYKQTSDSTGRKFYLDHCPFNEEHTGKDAVIYQYTSGGIGFHCFHDSCQGKTWRDVRMHYEPTAYEKRYDDYKAAAYGDRNRDHAVKMVTKHIVEEEGEPIFETADYILGRKEEVQTYVRTGTAEIDRRMQGLAKGCVSLVSGLRGSGKSSLMSEWGLNAIDDGNNVGFFSGELTDRRFLRWMLLQAAGKQFVQYGGFEGVYNVPRSTQERIAAWLGEHFWLYNNKYGNDFNAVMEQFEKFVVEKKLDMIILDNLMAMNVKGLSSDKYEAQSRFVLALVDLAHKYNIHVIFIAHPRKSQGFLRLDDISGTADLSNAVDNAFIVHRNNNDFKRLSAEMFSWSENEPVYQGDNVIEIVKDRENGNQDVFIPLYFEKETRRFKNDVAESKIYGWAKDADGFTPTSDNDEIPF